MTTSALDTVRRIVGRRSKITRDEMVAILMALDLPPEASTITGRFADGSLYVGKVVTDPAEERRAVAVAWERACARISVISVVDTAYYPRGGDETCHGLGVRYDDPGSMHPLQMAEIAFVAEALGGYEYDQVGQMRRHAKRLLIVCGEPSSDPVQTQ